MDKNYVVKNQMIEAAIELIEQSDGNIKSVTSRMIAEKAGVGLGLINYHFGSKDNLITECVQRIIGRLVEDSRVERKYATDRERFTAWAVGLMDFIFDHPALCRISILNDLENYTINSNSIYTQDKVIQILEGVVSEKNKHMLAFIIVSLVQTTFLGQKAVGKQLGYDFTKPEDRAAYVNRLIDIIYERTV